jgi:hypothetical protein
MLASFVPSVPCATKTTVGRRMAAAEEDDEGFPTTHKMEFPKYDGVGDPLPWLNQCERYFRVWRTLENRRVTYASFYLTDAQLWYHRLELNAGPPLWPRFVQLVNKRFGSPLTNSLIDELALLRHDDSVDDFAKRFMALSCRDTTITEVHQVKLFLAGLGKPLRTDVALHRPPMLDDAVMLALAYEQREATPPPPSVPRQQSSSRAQPKPMHTATGAAPASKPASSVKQLTPIEVAQRRKDGQCFHYDDFFTH